jgi:hypothetical protein
MNNPLSLILELTGVEGSKLKWSILKARSGIYLPAYDSPAIQNLAFLYSGYNEKKFFKASKLSFIVDKSSYLKVWLVLIEYPTPAGDYKKSKFDSKCQE